MIPKAKAKEMVEGYSKYHGQFAKEYALRAVEEIIMALLPEFKTGSYKEKFWQQVKAEIKSIA